MDDLMEDADAGAKAPEEEKEDCTYLAVIGKGKTFSYVVPSFPVYTAELQEAKFQYTNSKGDLQVFDAFARNCVLMNHPLPALARLQNSYKNIFFWSK